MSRRQLLLCALTLGLHGCALGPPARIYVLTAPVEARETRLNLSNKPRLQLLPVVVPDYLDTSEIVTRSGANEIKASTTARWGERLSQGIAHALIAALAQRLPDDFVTLDEATAKPGRQMLVNVTAFDVQADGRCELNATWTLVDNDARTILAERSGTFVAPSDNTSIIASDAAVVSGMTSTINKLAERMAETYQR
jgi:uncharacterized lipoprotein YmbA